LGWCVCELNIISRRKILIYELISFKNLRILIINFFYS
jgi:hypothetical protein